MAHNIAAWTASMLCLLYKNINHKDVHYSGLFSNEQGRLVHRSGLKNNETRNSCFIILFKVEGLCLKKQRKKLT